MKNYKKLLTLFTCNILICANLFAALPENISELVEDSAPAVVNITSKKEVSQRQSFGYGGIPDEMLERFGIPRQFREMPQEKRKATSYGSGFILKDNYILTNYHVVEDATEVIVSLSDRREFIAEIVGVDPLSDLALLKVEGKNLDDHLIHMLVHGLYHILGYDHENNDSASLMEAKEINKLKELNIKNPYL